MDTPQIALDKAKADERIFNATIEKAFKEDSDSDNSSEKKAIETSYSNFITPLGSKLIDLYNDAEKDRRVIEEQWLKDLRQYRGEYDPEVKKRLHPKRSHANLPITRTKVKSVTARQTDILFPANGEKNWGISTTKIPELSQQQIQNFISILAQQTGQYPTENQVLMLINDEATKRCRAMDKEIEDQLSEVKYRSIIRKVVQSGNLYGTGILKGPLVKRKKVKRWVPSVNGWDIQEWEKLVPYCEYVSLWDIYPDMSATEPENLKYIFQRYLFNRKQIYELSKRTDFNSKAIESYIIAHPDGDAEFKNHENDLRSLSRDSASGGSLSYNQSRYEVKEFWGYLNATELKNIGVDIPEDKLGLEVAANVWMLGPIVIKAILSPIEGVSFPYHWYYFDKDETSIFGQGLPHIMRDTQSLFNASVRAMLDNAAISAGPIIEANEDLLSPNEDPTDIYPFKVILRTGHGAEAQNKALNVTSLPSYTTEFLTMVEFFMNAADEVTAVPRYMYGDQSNMGGAGRTATGLSMLMGSVNITLKDQVKNFDDGITKPFITAMYFWNMDFNEKETIKGDFSVVAKGSSSLIAKEVRSEALNQFLAITNNEIDLPLINRDVILREIARNMDLDDLDLIKSTDQVNVETEQRNAAMEQEKAQMMAIEQLRAQSSGHMENNQQADSQGYPNRPQMEQLSELELRQGEIPNIEGVSVGS